MARKRNRRGRRISHLFLCIPLLLMMLLVTATTPGAIETLSPAASVPSPTAAPIPPVQENASVPAAELTASFMAQPAPTASGDTFSDVFVDVDTNSASAAQAPLAAEPQPVQASEPLPSDAVPAETPQPEATVYVETDPGHWEYDSGSIQVSIDRHTQGNFVYFAADIRLTDISQFSYAFANEKFSKHTETVSDIADRHDPLLAVNGDFCGFHDRGVIIRGGKLFRKQNSSRALLIVGADGKLSILTDRTEKQGLVAVRLLSEGVWHTFEFGPALVENGEAVKLHSTILRVEEGYLEPRTAIGQYADDPLHYLILVVDGRREGYSEGCDLPTLQKLFLDYGVETAFNLDGGGSTTLYYDGEVINRPASGEERKVSDIIMFMREANP
ncbi:MAG: phosphodiester glycosidase family protein [Candidatus Aphodomonas sp.]|nr:phosphodiester glycosidase family protein [Candidatus Aphodomonas sp.]